MPSYPYTSSQSALIQTFTQLRKGVPSKIDASYLQRFSIAPGNESYIISILRFLGIVDESGNRPDDATKYLFGSDSVFQSGLEDALRKAYDHLFEEMNDAFQADKSNLIHWFRAADKTSELVGKRQEATFRTLAALAGHGEVSNVRVSAPKSGSAQSISDKRGKVATAKAPSQQQRATSEGHLKTEQHDKDPASSDYGVGVTVRIEVNLPADGDMATYDAIFASIKKHLMS